MKFNELDLDKKLQKALVDIKFDTPTPIQESCIPVILSGKDLLGCAQTGSGKTAAFALPLLEKILVNQDHKTRGLILTPTRELALQMMQHMKLYSKYIDKNIVAIYG